MKHLILLLAILFPVSLIAQGRTDNSAKSRYIQGEVKLPDGRSAGVGLYVELESDASGGFLTTQTDSRGKFSFTSLANVRYRIRVRGPGFEEETQEIDLSTNPAGYLRFTLRPKATSEPQPVAGVTSAKLKLPDDMPKGAQKEFQKGFEIFSSGKEQPKSISHFKKAADAYPRFAATFYYLGVAQAIDKNFDEAAKTLRKSIELNDKAPEPLIALGAVYNNQKKFAEAEKLLKRAVELAPESFGAHEEYAKSILPDLQRTPEAELHLKKAVSLNPKSVEAHILLGNVYLRERNQEAALNEYQESLRLDPTGPMSGPTKAMVDKLKSALKEAKK